MSRRSRPGGIPAALDTRRGRELIVWIALNDNSGNGDSLLEVAGYVSVVMLAHVYDVPAIKIAEAVMKIRGAAEVGL